MFGFLKKKPVEGEHLSLAITGMHCTSCALTVDGVLEDTDGVLSASTSYARAVTKIVFNSEKISKEKILQILEKLEYTFQEIKQ